MAISSPAAPGLTLQESSQASDMWHTIDMKFSETHSDALEHVDDCQNDQQQQDPTLTGHTGGQTGAAGCTEPCVDLPPRSRDGPHRSSKN